MIRRTVRRGGHDRRAPQGEMESGGGRRRSAVDRPRVRGEPSRGDRPSRDRADRPVAGDRPCARHPGAEPCGARSGGGRWIGVAGAVGSRRRSRRRPRAARCRRRRGRDVAAPRTRRRDRAADRRARARRRDRPSGEGRRAGERRSDYLILTVAPASSSSFLSFSASSLEMPVLTALGAASTRSLASFRPRPVAARTTLMTLILLAPKASRTTSNSVLAAAASAAAAAAAGAGDHGGGGGLDPVDDLEVVAQGLGLEDGQLDDRVAQGLDVVGERRRLRRWP